MDARRQDAWLLGAALSPWYRTAFEDSFARTTKTSLFSDQPQETLDSSWERSSRTSSAAAKIRPLPLETRAYEHCSSNEGFSSIVPLGSSPGSFPRVARPHVRFGLPRSHGVGS